MSLRTRLALGAAALALVLALPGRAANPGNPLGNAAFEGTGISVGDPGTGRLESLLPIQSLTGAGHTYAQADLQRRTRRANGGAAMSDTLMPAGSAGLANGAQIHVANADGSASLTLAAGSGTSIDGAPSLTLSAGREVWLAYDPAATAWRVIDDTSTTLLGTNNLADLTSTSAAQANHGLPTSYCALAGCALTGPLTTTPGTAGTPGLGVGVPGTGFYETAGGGIGFATGGVSAGVVDSGQRVIIGSTGPIGGSVNELQINGATDNFGFGSPPAVTQFRANGTLNSPTAIVSGQTAGQFRGEGYDGSAFQITGSLVIAATGSIGAGVVPGQAVIRTANSTGVNTIGLVVDSNQNLNVGPSGITKIADASGDLFAKYAVFSGLAAPTLSSGNGAVYASSLLGGIFTGLGTQNDLTLQNGAGVPVLEIPTGSTQLRLPGVSSWTSNGSVATTITGVGPAGAHSTIQEWLTVIDSAGNVRYIPAY